MKIFLLFAVLFFAGCGGNGNGTEGWNALTLDGPVDGARISVTTPDGTFETVSKNGRWHLFPLLLPGEGNVVVRITSQGGSVNGRSVEGNLTAWAEAKDVLAGTVSVGTLSTFASAEASYTKKSGEAFSAALDRVAKALLEGDGNGTADFRTLYACDADAACVSARERLLEGGLGEVIRRGEDLETWMAGDDDGDGIANETEVMLRLLPNRSDSDDDTLSDGDELYRYGTRADLSDTDGDFIPDPMEIAAGTDPNAPDEDADGTADGLEGDPFFHDQWYLYDPVAEVLCNTVGVSTVAGNDLGVLPVYHQTLGALHAAQSVQVVDGGVDLGHEDLVFDMEHSWNSITHTNDPTPTEAISTDPVRTFYRGHGTAVAGIIGATAMNGKGVRGVAPQVRIAGSNWLESEAIGELSAVWLGGDDTVTISNNSWGARYLNDRTYETLIEEALQRFRGGKGRLFVFAAGNDREEFGNANLSYLTNNPYVIAVAALNHENKVASYSSPGANVLVAAYGGEHFYTAPTIMTTFTPHQAMDEATLAGRKGPITVDEDTERSYTYAMNGTSAAAPIVSGALALVLDMCPDLGYRDVIRLIALSAKQIDPQNGSWVRNAAGLWHSNDYGYGLINPEGMIEKCRSRRFVPLPAEQTVTGQATGVPRAIPDNNTTISVPITVQTDITVEWVGITVTIDHPYAGDLAIELVSPSGTRSRIIDPNFLNGNAYLDGFRFSSSAFKEEHGRGTWQLQVRDALPEDSGALKSAVLQIRGYTP